MNAAGVTWPSQSICVTCLSQDRKLFPVNEFKFHASFLFNVSEDDRLCWECHFFVRKVAAFQSRAAKAQALLASALLQTDVAKINCLSSLVVTPVCLEISLETPNLPHGNIKEEIIKEECESTLYECHTEDISDTVHCDESRQGMDDDDKSLLRVLKKTTKAKGDEGACGEAMAEDIANASLKSLLSRKSTLIIKPLADQYKDDIITSEIEKGDVLRKKEVGKREPEDNLNQCEVTCNSHSVYWDEDESSEGISDEILLPVLNNQTEATRDEEVCGEAMSDDIANASLKSLLSRKSMLSSISPLAMKFKTKKLMTEIDDVIEVPEKKEAKGVGKVNQTAPIDPDSNYTVVELSEEEILKWRERKKNMPEYATTATGLRCKQCIEPFKRLKVYVAHARRHEEDYGAFACRICGVRSVTESSLSTHTAHHYRLLKCKLCAHEWDSPNAMREHCSAAHGIPATVWDCDQCDRKYSTSIQLAKHVVAHRVVACRVCGARVAQNSFALHSRQHTSVQRTCPVCEKQCLGDVKLASHMKSHDPKVDEAAYCAECNAQFRTMSQYRTHLRYTLKHARSDDMPYKCGECGKAYLKQSSLKIHIESMHSAEMKYACSVCGQKFKTRKRKNDHVRRIHKRVEQRKFICDYCGKNFTTKATLHGHINSHTGARPFACTLCDATFSYKSALYLHGRFKHKIKKKSDAK